MSDAPMSPEELEKFVGVLRKRQSVVERLVQVAENVCIKLEKRMTISENQIDVFRDAIAAVKNSRIVGS